MKTIIKGIMLTLCLAVAVAFAMNVNTDVQAKSKVTCKLKKGTLTIKGKGNMPKKIKVKKKKVKKVVIKKGVKNISNNAFNGFTKLKKVSIASSVKTIGVNAFKKTALKKLTIPKNAKKLGTGFIDNCKKLETVTVPGSFNIINKSGKVQKNRKSTSGTDLDTVTFSTNLDYNVCAYFRTYSFQTAANDTQFKTFDGVVYTKDGSGIVRVPSARDTVTLRDECTDFYTYAVTYMSDGSNTPVCFDLAKVTLPKSVVRVDDEKYPDKGTSTYSKNLDIVFNDTKLEIPELVKIKNTFSISAEALSKKLPTRIVKNENGMYIGDNTYLVQGNNLTDSVVPDGIKTICEKAYNGIAVTNVTLPTSVTEIDNNAFENTYLKTIDLSNVKTIGKRAFKGTQFEKIELPAAITAVPDGLFYDCQMLTEVTFKGDLKSVGEKSFYNTRINVSDFLNANTKLETIGESAFENVGWTNITIPANVKTVSKFAFYETSNTKFVTIKGSTSGFDPLAFGKKIGLTYQFEKGITEAWVAPNSDSYKSGKKMKYAFAWDKVSEVNGYDIWLAKDKNLKKGVKKFTAKYNEKSKTVSLTKKKAKGIKYYGMRPYKTVNGKKVYGKWFIGAL